MARVIERLPERPSAKYPWSEWLDGRVWELIPGEDFSAKPSTFRANAQIQAKKRGGRAHIRSVSVDGRERLALQFRAS